MSAAPDWPGRAELAIRARERWRQRLVPVCGLAVVLVVLGVAVDTTARSDTGSRVAATVLGALVGFAIVLVVLAVMALAGRAGRGPLRNGYVVPIVLGLERPDRRRVYRSIRDGEIDTDRMLANVEHEMAHRVLRRRRAGNVIFPVVIALEAVSALADGLSPFERLYPVVLCVGCFVAWVYTLGLQRGAARLIAAAHAVQLPNV